MSSAVKSARNILEEWETRTTFSDAEIDALSSLQSMCNDLPLPSLPTSDDDAGVVVRSPTAADGVDSDAPIQNAQQFFLWYASVEESMERGQEDVYRAYLDEVSAYKATCDGLYDKGTPTA